MKKTLAVLAVAGVLSPCMLFAQQADTTSAEKGEVEHGYNNQMNAGQHPTKKHHHKKSSTTTSDTTTNSSSTGTGTGSGSGTGQNPSQ